MGYSSFYNKLNSMEGKEYIETFLAYSLSLVIAGAKPASTLSIKKTNIKLYNSWNTYGPTFIKSMKLNYVELRDCLDATVIMVYDEFILEKHLNTKYSMDFLINLGYPTDGSITDHVNTLKLRYEKYHCPHELGLFLGIPINDVKDFMECTTKKCLLCKYWKVYNDSNKAQAIFKKYDEIKEYTIDTLLKGNTSHRLALIIKDSFYENICEI